MEAVRTASSGKPGPYGQYSLDCSGRNWQVRLPSQARRKHFLSGTATGEGSGDSSARSAEKFFHLHFSVVWIGCRSTFVLYTALPRPYLAMGKWGATAPTEKLASEYNKIFVHSS